jgi:hypothetical protein
MTDKLVSKDLYWIPTQVKTDQDTEEARPTVLL